MSAVALTIRALLAKAGVTSTTSTRIFPLPLPPSTSLPAIAVTLGGEAEEQLLGGASQYPESSVQVHCIAETARGAIELGEAVKTALRDHLYQPGDSPPSMAAFRKEPVDFTDFSDTGNVHRRVMVFTVRWR